MSKEEIKEYLHKNIPLAKAMGVEVVDIGKRSLTLKAPLSNNSNMHGTAFGGSLSSIALLTGWTLIHTKVSGQWLPQGDLVIAEAHIHYQKPVATDLVAQAKMDEAQFQQFIETYKEKGKARLTVEIEVKTDKGPGCRLEGIYALIQA
ncbi:YiiD C-terminal domain-containing protein [Litoribrevibacter euphylliae]|uniref:YiiD C-terminal domain-containing protein n=1 Tax=Litoribrevibacter euphylliae TaxID=1834034 RepID=A0ABV7HFQ6_9GAMM